MAAQRGGRFAVRQLSQQLSSTGRQLSAVSPITLNLMPAQAMSLLPYFRPISMYSLNAVRASNIYRNRPRVDLPLGPGLFEVRNALKTVDEMNKLPMPMLVMCKSGNRAGSYSTISTAYTCCDMLHTQLRTRFPYMRHLPCTVSRQH